jgi:hypothetical protein
VLLYRQGEPLTDEDLERQLRWVDVDCVDPDSIDQGELLAFSQGPVSAERAQSIQTHLDRCKYCLILSSEYRRMSLERAKKRRLFLATGGGLAAAAIIALALFVPSREQTMLFEPTAVRGTVAETMAAPNDSALPKQPWRFASTSTLELILSPKTEHEKGSVPVVDVYSAPVGGKLIRVESVFVKRENQDSDYPVLRITGSGRDIFGSSAGPQVLFVTLTPKSESKDDLNGKSVDAAKQLLPKSVQAWSFDVIYELAGH